MRRVTETDLPSLKVGDHLVKYPDKYESSMADVFVKDDYANMGFYQIIRVPATEADIHFTLSTGAIEGNVSLGINTVLQMKYSGKLQQRKDQITSGYWWIDDKSS